MVIFHSDISSPEGVPNPSLNSQWLKKRLPPMKVNGVESSRSFFNSPHRPRNILPILGRFCLDHFCFQWIPWHDDSWYIYIYIHIYIYIILYIYLYISVYIYIILVVVSQPGQLRPLHALIEHDWKFLLSWRYIEIFHIDYRRHSIY